MNKQIDVWDYAGHIMKNIGSGILLTTCKDGKVNSMTIGWGQLGVIWSKPVFTVLGQVDKTILAVCGTKSGRDMDKLAQLGLNTVPGQKIPVPAIRELPLTLECRVIYRQEQDPSAIDKACFDRFYTMGTRNEGDYHTVYYGEIINAYIIEEANQ